MTKPKKHSELGTEGKILSSLVTDLQRNSLDAIFSQCPEAIEQIINNALHNTPILLAHNEALTLCGAGILRSRNPQNPQVKYYLSPATLNSIIDWYTTKSASTSYTTKTSNREAEQKGWVSIVIQGQRTQSESPAGLEVPAKQGEFHSRLEDVIRTEEVAVPDLGAIKGKGAESRQETDDLARTRAGEVPLDLLKNSIAPERTVEVAALSSALHAESMPDTREYPAAPDETTVPALDSDLDAWVAALVGTDKPKQ
jgi:hypothetical protein